MPSSFENKVIWWWILFLSSDKCYHIITTRLTNMNLLNPHTLNITNGVRGIKNNVWVLDKTVKAKQNPESSELLSLSNYNLFLYTSARMGLFKTNQIMSTPAPNHLGLPKIFPIQSKVTTLTSPYMIILFPTTHTHTLSLCSSHFKFFPLCWRMHSSQILLAHTLIFMKVLFKCHLWNVFSDHLTLSPLYFVFLAPCCYLTSCLIY